MAQVNRPQKRPDELNSLLTIGGGVAGVAAGGGVSGALAGAGAGSTVGGIVNPEQPQQEAVPAPQAGALQRRQQQLSQDNLALLKRSEASLPSLPEPLRQQYGPAIIQARMMEEKRRGLR